MSLREGRGGRSVWGLRVLFGVFCGCALVFFRGTHQSMTEKCIKLHM